MPMAIVVAGIIIAGSIFLSGKGSGISAIKNAPTPPALTGTDKKEISLRPVSPDDHILGNPNADLVIVEYSDPECPFCKSFHRTMKTILNTYGKNGKVAWVYRQFPLDSIHPKSRKEAEAIECAAELGGNQKFFEYLDGLFAVTPSNNGLDLTELPNIAERVGLDRKKFETCLASGKYAAKIEANYQDGLAAGVDGTPYSVIISKDGTKTPIHGAQPLSVVDQMIQSLLAGK